MNALELKHLTSGSLSHIARSLYAFFLRPRAERGIRAITLNEASSYLQCTSEVFPTSSDLRIADLALSELEKAGFIRRGDLQKGWDGAVLSFPLYTSELRELPQKPFPMTPSWRPGPGFAEACRACGLEDPSFEERERSRSTGPRARRAARSLPGSARSPSAWRARAAPRFPSPVRPRRRFRSKARRTNPSPSPPRGARHSRLSSKAHPSKIAKRPCRDS